MGAFLEGFYNITKGVLLGIKMAVIITFFIFVAFLVLDFNDFSISDVLNMVTDVKEFSITDVADGAVEVVVDGVADVTVGIYDFIMDSVHSQDLDTGLNAMLDVIGFNSFDSLVKSVASTVKSSI